MLCGRSHCRELKAKRCSGCMTEGYCSSDCQKADWKFHKLVCACMKNNDQLLPFRDITATVRKLSAQAELKNGISKIKILEYCLSFLEFQYGERIAGESFRKREVDGTRVDNWVVDFDFLILFCNNISETYKFMADNMVMNDICVSNLNKAKYYTKKSLSILEYWRIQLDLDATKRIDRLDDRKCNMIYKFSSSFECTLGEINISLVMYDEVGAHCNRAISFAKKLGEGAFVCNIYCMCAYMIVYHVLMSLYLIHLYVVCCIHMHVSLYIIYIYMIGDERLYLLYEALIALGMSLCLQHKFSEGRVQYEEAYNLVVTAHYPSHPMVLKAANYLIDVLMHLEEYDCAECYARVCYECVTKPIDTESLDVATAADCLSIAILKLIRVNGPKGGDIMEAEKLARKAVRIVSKEFGPDSDKVGGPLGNLCDVLTVVGSHDDEVKKSYERCIAMFVRCDGPDGDNVAQFTYKLAIFLSNNSNCIPPGNVRNAQLLKAKGHYKEAIRICTKLNGPNHPRTLQYKSSLSQLTRFI